jgi:hypothetical protein
MTPFLFSSQGNDNVIGTLKTEGFRMGSERILRRRDKPDMNAGLFAEYISKVFLPHIARVRSHPRFSNEQAVLVMDNCSVQVRPDILQILADNHVKVITFPPHTTNIFQCLDLSLFSVLKKKMKSRLPLERIDSASTFIKRIVHNMKQALVPDNVRRAFVHIGMRYRTDVDPYLLIFDGSVLRESQRFLALWHCGDLLQELPPRRRNARFG